ncbi:MAG: GTPase HflX [Candidatus Shikimatogenerans sp. Tduv]|uniref:GTPase HflX n=1 Tax=Candidatus Shikimatogenerans sp. Tduv TaxID=3158567 RepID=A0AAU7QRM9_9FLAO
MYKAILIGFINKKQNKKKCLENLQELELLINNLKKFNIIKKYIQRIRKINSQTYIGKGKFLEIKKFIILNNINYIIFDDKISSIQYKNIEKKFNFKINIIDRTYIILKIFKKRSKDYNSKIQIKLAKNKYLLTKLNKKWQHLKRQKGGINFKGPGEKELETDKRIIKKKIFILNKKNKKINKQISTQIKHRKNVKQISIIGYTNSGKSTISNLILKKKHNLIKNQLFSTINTKTKKIYLNKKIILITDTVGFIKKLPKILLNSFYTTLNSIKNANIILSIIDLSSLFIEDYIKYIINIYLKYKINYNNIINIFNKTDINIYNYKKLSNIINKYKIKNFLFFNKKKKINIIINKINKILNIK